MGGSCNIICTQPRRISAISVAERVATERGETAGLSVGYQVRLDSKSSRHTRLTFCTTGILLRRLFSDPILQGITHVVMDGGHEREIRSDFLLLILKDLILKRKDIKIVLMSATLNAQLFSEYFSSAVGSSPPCLHIPGRTFPVDCIPLERIVDMIQYRGAPAEYLKSRSSVHVTVKRPFDDIEKIEADAFLKVSPKLSIMEKSLSPQVQRYLDNVDEGRINYDLLGKL